MNGQLSALMDAVKDVTAKFEKQDATIAKQGATIEDLQAKNGALQAKTQQGPR
jgi:hypothetical protein